MQGLEQGSRQSRSDGLEGVPLKGPLFNTVLVPQESVEV